MPLLSCRYLNQTKEKETFLVWEFALNIYFILFSAFDVISSEIHIHYPWKFQLSSYLTLLDTA